jgi:hypothetical protein
MFRKKFLAERQKFPLVRNNCGLFYGGHGNMESKCFVSTMNPSALRGFWFEMQCCSLTFETVVLTMSRDKTSFHINRI